MDPRDSETTQSVTINSIQHWRRQLSGTGVVMVLLGILAIIMPVVSSYAVSFLIGAVLIFGGLFATLWALAFRGTRAFVWLLLAGVFPLCAGLYLLVFPASGLATLTFIIAAIFLLTGVAQSLSAFDMGGLKGAGWVLISGLISIALGVSIFAVLPEASTVVLGILLGIDLISTGLSLILLSNAVSRDF
ncbi:MAG: uncharacterized membrane protein HdeD (DUF308 family) [Celeribacter sp.]|jgi:uncharacterized membrane protein HdeD (DUF308 family)